MDSLIVGEQRKVDRWSKAALSDLSPKQQRWVDSMMWSGFTVRKARLSGSKSDLKIILERTCVLLTDDDEPIAKGMSEEMRECIVDKNGRATKGRVQFRWTPE